MTRLQQLKAYLAEAELDPDNNQLYIEDLKISIAYESMKVKEKLWQN